MHSSRNRRFFLERMPDSDTIGTGRRVIRICDPAFVAQRDQTALLAGRCEELGLLSTGSSDYHGPEHGTFSTFRAFATYGLQPRLGPLAEP